MTSDILIGVSKTSARKALHPLLINFYDKLQEISDEGNIFCSPWNIVTFSHEIQKESSLLKSQYLAMQSIPTIMSKLGCA